MKASSINIIKVTTLPDFLFDRYGVYRSLSAIEMEMDRNCLYASVNSKANAKNDFGIETVVSPKTPSKTEKVRDGKKPDFLT